MRRDRFLFVPSALSVLLVLLCGCGHSPLVDASSTTHVLLSDTPGFGGCTIDQTLALDLGTHALTYAVCTAGSSSPNVARGTVTLDDSDYASFLSALEAMKTGSSNEGIDDAGDFSADVTDSGGTSHYIDARTASGSDATQALGVIEAFQAGVKIVDALLSTTTAADGGVRDGG